MNRRDFLRASGAGCLALLDAKPVFARAQPSAGGTIMTVVGPIRPAEFGSALSHEHVLVDFIGADKVSRERYDPAEAFDVALPYLRRARELGCRGFVECTPAYLGRDPRLLARLASAAGLHILTNTGYYGAANDKYVPRHAHEESADQLADRWSREWVDGIEGTGIRPGFIKTGVDAGPLSEIDRTLVRAAARTHARTGLTIASHTGNTQAALEQFEILAQEHVRPDAFIWVHAQSDWELESRVRAARTGAWIEIDNIDAGTVSAVRGAGDRAEAARRPEPPPGLARRRLVQAWRAEGRRLPGIRHRLHRLRPRAAPSRLDDRRGQPVAGVQSRRRVHQPESDPGLTPSSDPTASPRGDTDLTSARTIVSSIQVTRAAPQAAAHLRVLHSGRKNEGPIQLYRTVHWRLSCSRPDSPPRSAKQAATRSASPNHAQVQVKRSGPRNQLTVSAAPFAPAVTKHAYSRWRTAS